MVVKIQPPAHKLEAALAYNMNKASGMEGILDAEQSEEYLHLENTGHIVTTRNVPETTSLEMEFERLKFKNRTKTRGRRMENFTFHMSINPGVNDRTLSEKEIASLTDELMSSLGYGNVPYRLFRHDDTGRTHYHVVSIRIDQDGKKINDSFENLRCERICRGMENRYGFVYGLGEEEQEEQVSAKNDKAAPTQERKTEPQAKEKDNRDRKKKAAKEEKQTREFIHPFEKKSDIPIKEQFKKFHSLATQWSFTTPEQYAAILRCRYRTKAEIYNDSLTFSGLDLKGRTVTANIPQAEIEPDALKQVLSICEKTSMGEKRNQRERVQNTAREAAEKAADWNSFIRFMERKGIYTVLSWNKNNELFGVTWLDRATRCAWKGSETDIDLQWLTQTAREKGWTIEKNLLNDNRESSQNISAKNKMENIRTHSRGGYPKEMSDRTMPVSDSKMSHENANEGADMDFGEYDPEHRIKI